MADKLHEIMLRAHTALFAQKVCDALSEMTNTKMEMQADTLTKGFYKSMGTFTSFMHFAGTVQGEFSITTELATAAKIASLTIPEHESEAARDAPLDECADFLGETLNVASGRTLPELEKRFGRLTITPPCSVFGKIRFPNVASGNIELKGSIGWLHCALLINMANLKSIESATKKAQTQHASLSPSP